jgi:hypothetical protein
MRKRKCLVWVRSIAGPQPQIWSPDAFEISQKRIDASVVAIFELPDNEATLPLQTLAKLRPPPVLAE